MHFLPPNQQRQSTEGIDTRWKYVYYGTKLLETNYPISFHRVGHMDGAILLATRWSR